MISPEDRAKLSETIESATLAPSDTEAALKELADLARLRAPDPIVEARYEQLRGQLTQRLQAEGARYWLDETGAKWVAYAITPESVVVDLDYLSELHEQGTISDVDYEKVAPRKIDPTVFRRLATRKRNPLSQEQVIRAATVLPKTGHVRFVRAESDQDQD